MNNKELIEFVFYHEKEIKRAVFERREDGCLSKTGGGLEHPVCPLHGNQTPGTSGHTNPDRQKRKSIGSKTETEFGTVPPL